MNSAFITSYERDNESDLDFAQARYYSSKLGRFYSADEPFFGQNENDPQTWNLFAYTSNNPINRYDPDGHRWYYQRDNDGNTLNLTWVNPNEDGSYTAPEGEGWQAFIPTDDNRTMFLGATTNGQSLYIGEDRDGTPFTRSLWTGKTQPSDEDLIGAMSFVRGAAKVLGVIGREAFAKWFAAEAAKDIVKLTAGEVTAIGEKAVEEVAKQQAQSVIKGFTKHGINQAISRDGVGVSSKAILDAVKNPTKVINQADGAVKYVGKNATVILNKAGEVITTWARNSAGRRIKP